MCTKMYVDNVAFRLHYHYTFKLLAFLSFILIITEAQLGGIRCNGYGKEKDNGNKFLLCLL